MPKRFMIFIITVFPAMSVFLFLFTTLVLPSALRAPTKWPIVLLVTVGPWLMAVVAFLGDLRHPRRIRLEAGAMMWDSGLGRRHVVPRANVLRLEPLENRRRGLAMCVFVDGRGAESWVAVTTTNEERIRTWLEGRSSD